MPSPRRRAEPRTAAAISEDLRLVREAGGIESAAPAHLQGVFAFFYSISAEDEDDAADAARIIFATHLRRTCEVAVAASDPCSVAAAKSLAASMLRQAGVPQKVANIRRASLSDAGCQLSVDGLRKREDNLIDAVAEAIYEDMMTRRAVGGPQTVEEVVRHIGPMIATVHEELHDGLPMVYTIAPHADERVRRGFMWETLLGVAAAIEHLRRIVELHAGPGTHSSVDFLFADIAQHAFVVTFPDSDDKRIIHEVLANTEHWNVDSLINGIKARGDGDAFLDRWGEWITSCHATCAYQRADVVRLCCRPHQLTTALQEFGVNYQLLMSSDLEAFLDEDLKAWALHP